MQGVQTACQDEFHNNIEFLIAIKNTGRKDRCFAHNRLSRSRCVFECRYANRFFFGVFPIAATVVPQVDVHLLLAGNGNILRFACGVNHFFGFAVEVGPINASFRPFQTDDAFFQVFRPQVVRIGYRMLFVRVIGCFARQPRCTPI